MLLGLTGCPPKFAGYCEEDTALPDTPGAKNYYSDVEPIVRKACGECHRAGGIGPFSLRTYEQVKTSFPAMKAAIQSHRMPPWQPAKCCTSYRHDGSLSALEQATLFAWAEQGFAEGVPPATPPTPMESGLPRVDVTLQMPEPYVPKPPPGRTDDTRCFLLDWPAGDNAGTRYVTGLDVKPGAPALVHHVLVLLASPEDVADLEKRDAAEEGPGWSCPGGVVRFSGYLGGWVPGQAASAFPDGLGHEVKPGTKVLLTVHYSPHDTRMLPADQTSVLLRVQQEATTPMKAIAVYDFKWLLGQMVIPANSTDTRYHFSYDPTPFYSDKRPMLLHAVNLHMHERGAKGTVALLKKDGTQECLIQIDRYDHAWQGDYQFAEPKRLEPGDQLFIECQWDNSELRQRIIDGVRQPARTLNWAEDQEMCVGFVTASILP